MSDYLSNLVARTANQTETIQPRLQSLFEPARSMRELDWQETVDLEMEESLIESDRPMPLQEQHGINEISGTRTQPEPARIDPPIVSPIPPPIQPPIPPTPSLADIPIDSRMDPPYSLKDTPKQQQTTPDSITPIIRHETAASSLPTDLSQASPQPAIRPAITEHIVVKRIIQTETNAAPAMGLPNADVQSVNDIQSEDEIKPAAFVPASIPKASPVSNQSLSLPGPIAEKTNDPPSATRPDIYTSVTPQIRLAPSPVPPPEAPNPVPIVQVKIGRIEVRATQSSATRTDKPRAPSPVMSLEDYLRQRGGGS